MNRAWRYQLPAVPGVAPGAGLGLGGQVDDLMEACGPEQMLEAAASLRRMALDMRRLMAHPHAALVLAVLLEEPGVPGQDPARLPARLADQAVNVVTAADYLIALLHPPPVTALRLAAAPDGAQGLAGGQAPDRLVRQRLDARAAAVREGMRLQAMLPAGTLIVARPPDGGPAPEGGGAR